MTFWARAKATATRWPTRRPSLSPRAERIADTARGPGVLHLLGLPGWAPRDPSLTSGEDVDEQTLSRSPEAVTDG